MLCCRECGKGGDMAWLEQLFWEQQGHPLEKLGGALRDVKAAELGGIAIQAALQRADIVPQQVEEVIFLERLCRAGKGKSLLVKLPGTQTSPGRRVPKRLIRYVHPA
ncbi:hypothetical protein GCM10020331_022620 [Ectobacillus funiculus]